MGFDDVCSTKSEMQLGIHKSFVMTRNLTLINNKLNELYKRVKTNSFLRKEPVT